MMLMCSQLKKMLSESHQLGRELKEKVVATVSDQEESDEEEQYLEKLQEDPEDTPTNDDGGLLISTSKNPWLSSSDAGACEQPSERNEVADLKTTGKRPPCMARYVGRSLSVIQVGNHCQVYVWLYPKTTRVFVYNRVRIPSNCVKPIF